MRYLNIRTLILLVLSVIASACSPKAPDDPVFKQFDLSIFNTDSANIDNQWMPLTPGTQYVYEGVTVENGQEVPHRVMITVTDLTKEIAGVSTRVTWDLDYSDGQLVEAELAFFAQDKDGNVWRMGEYPEEYDGEKILDNPTWIHGLDNALAGIAMYADPQPGTPDYPEGWGPEVDWTDRGQVDKFEPEVCVATGCYQNVLIIKETSATEEGAFQLKYWAPGVGNVLVDWTGADKTQERLELVEYNTLTPEEMKDVRTKAFELEKSAYENSKDVYVDTSPME